MSDVLGRVILSVHVAHHVGAPPHEMLRMPVEDLRAIASYVSDLEARLEKSRKVIEPFAEESPKWALFDGREALVEYFADVPDSSLSVADLRAARAWMEQNDE